MRRVFGVPGIDPQRTTVGREFLDVEDREAEAAP